MFTEKNHFLEFTLTFPVSYHEKTNLDWFIHYYIFAFAYSLLCLSLILKLKNLRKYFYLTDIPTNSLIMHFEIYE